MTGFKTIYSTEICAGKLKRVVKQCFISMELTSPFHPLEIKMEIWEILSIYCRN
jgi:hypothetical protein